MKDEGLLDRFDQVFGKVFKGLETSYGTEAVPLPEEWLKAIAEKYLTPEEMAAIASLGSWEEIMAALKERLAEQQGRHQGGSKWIGTGGTSPSAIRLHPEGVSSARRKAGPRAQGLGQARIRTSTASGTRHTQHQVALRRLRFAREGAAEESTRRTVSARRARGWSTSRCGPSDKR